MGMIAVEVLHPARQQDAPSSIQRRSWLPALVLLAACAVGILALSHAEARQQGDLAAPLYWAGLILLYTPIAVRLTARDIAASERMALVVVLGLGLYLMKVTHSPTAFTFRDEIAHWRTTDDAVQAGQFLTPGTPISKEYSRYPALFAVVAALSQTAGVSYFAGAILLLGLIRVVFCFALFKLFELASGSSRVAGLATAVYMGNPNFVYFDAQFAYETYALPLGVLFMWLVGRRLTLAPPHRRAIAAVAGLVGVTVVVGHHLTSYATVALLVTWGVFHSVRTIGGPGGRWAPIGAAAAMAGATVTWLVVVGGSTLGYVGPVLSGAVDGLVEVVRGTGEEKTFFQAGGKKDPLLEQLLGFGSVALILLVAPLGLLEVWRRRRGHALACAMGLAVLAYPLTLALRLTQVGTETSNRASEFLFVGLSLACGAFLVHRWLPSRASSRGLLGERLRPLRTVVFSCWATVVFLGGIIVGWPPSARQPGPYLPAAGPRSIDAQGTALAFWARDHIRPGTRVFADGTNALLLGSYGRLHPVFGFISGRPVATVLFSERFGDLERDIVRGDRMRYLVTDLRLSTALPIAGAYVEGSERGLYTNEDPLSRTALDKFAQVPELSRVYDSGDIAVYDAVRLLPRPGIR